MKSFKLLKTLCFAILAALTIAGSPASAQGTLPIALVQQIDINGQPLAGCIVSFFVAGTVATPQYSYSDFGLTQNPLAQLNCDQTGRVPMFWLANGLIHVRLTDSSGVVIIDTTMQVLGPSSGGGGGGGTVDPTTILATGDEKIRYGTGPLTGFVRENGLTIGSSVSGATERANADTQNLFIYLYGTDPNLTVSGGRTGNALADFNANKTITLPDMRGRINAFLDDMGNTAAGRLSSPYFTTPTTLGAAGGLQDMPGLATTNLPSYTPSGTVTSSFSGSILGTYVGSFQGGSGANGLTNSGSLTVTGSVSSSFAGANNGGHSTPFSILPPIMLRTQYIKL